MKRRLALVGFGCWLALAVPVAAWGATDYDGDGFIADDCAPLDGAMHPGAADVPDIGLEDLDCDGIDGTAAGAFFVSSSGSDAGTGSKDSPFRTIAFALAQAAAVVPKRDVYLQAGRYTEHVVLVGGVSVYGGYGPGGTRALAPDSTIQAPAGHPEAVLADGAAGVELQMLTIEGPVTGAEASSYALRAIGGASLALTAVKANGGSAGAGTAGSPGNVGAQGANGRCGAFSVQFGCTQTTDLSHSGGAGGSGAAGGGAAGGAGAGGVLNSNGATGTSGSGAAAGSGGVGGLPFNGTCSSNPTDASYCGGRSGGNGGPGADGATGAGAMFGTAGAGATWLNPTASTTGAMGAIGSSAGGGGSGRSSSGSCFSGAGGGGGGSGTGGTGGTGGSNGGGSFAVYVAGSAVVVDGGSLTGGHGGDGGKGGDGGLGGNGGGGGAGQAAPSGCFAGGSGGAGGKGGQGGGGGGGAGGPSVGVFATGNANFAVRSNATVAGGTAGAGGAPGAGGSATPANNGGAGASAGTQGQAGANSTPQDFDADGKKDSADACPAVAGSGPLGCPGRPAKLADGDGDGIPDGNDACPAQARGSTDTDTNGCPGNQSDSDGDGYVADGQDCNDDSASIHPGAIEIVGNAVDENCDKVIAPFPRVTATVSTAGRSTRTTTFFQRLLIREVPARGVVELRCSGRGTRCPFKSRKLRVSSKSTANALSLLSKRKRKRGLAFKPGATLEVRISAPDAIAKVVRFVIVPRRFPVGKTLCLPPGVTKPAACRA